MHVMTDEAIHVTDLSFIRFCEQQFGINRGVYNSIDSMFYDKGIKHIVARRSTILTFLAYITAGSGAAKKSSHKFGHGGLVAKINEFWMEKAIDVQKQTLA